MKRALIAALTVVAAVVGSASAAGATGGSNSAATTPLVVQATTFTQSGQSVAWTLQMKQSFSPAGLQGSRRTLCLLLERAATGSVAAQLCVTGPARKGGVPRLAYMRISVKGPGRTRIIAATVTLSRGRSLVATFLPGQAGLAYNPLRWQVISTLRTPACVAHHSANGCVALVPAKPTLLALHVPRLVGCVAAGPTWVFSAVTRQRVIALTFDDGPSPYTSQLLTLLESEHVPATFFELGKWISVYGQGGAIERRMLADGDMIGDHTWDHADLAHVAAPAATLELTRTAGAIRAAARGFTPCLFRAPYGDVSPALTSLARSLGFTTIQWNIDPRDWALPGVSAIAGNVITNARPGAIVIQHDGGGNRSQTVAAVKIEIDTLKSRGYRFETVTDLLGYRLIYK